VENQVGVGASALWVKNLEELNARLLDGVAYARAHKHPEFKEHTGMVGV
jgi:hypothetical protein